MIPSLVLEPTTTMDLVKAWAPLMAYVGSFAAAFGLVLGSFANVVILRVPEDEPCTGRSHCPTCNTDISAGDLVPVLSWLWLRGRSRCCQQRISAQYPLVEMSMTVLFVLASCWLTFINRWDLLPVVAYFVFVGLVLSVIDAMTFRLPDKITKPAVLVTFLLSIHPLVGDTPSTLHGFMWGVGLWGGAFLAMRIANPKGIGLGDVKIAPMIGAVTGLFGQEAVFTSFGWAFVLAFVYVLCRDVVLKGTKGTKGGRVAFGPFMFLGAALGIVFGDLLADWYMGLFF